MTDQEIKTGNKLIAEFMGYKVFEKRYPKNHGVGGGMIECNDIILEKCKYHLSWDWLISAVKKFDDISYNKVNKDRKQELASLFIELGEATGRYNIEEVYYYLLKAINWFNEFSKSPLKKVK